MSKKTKTTKPTPAEAVTAAAPIALRDLAADVQARITAEGRHMLPDIALVEHILDLAEAALEECCEASVEAQRAAQEAAAAEELKRLADAPTA